MRGVDLCDGDAECRGADAHLCLKRMYRELVVLAIVKTAHTERRYPLVSHAYGEGAGRRHDLG